jgi:iron complex outermembrane receptor protein
MNGRRQILVSVLGTASVAALGLGAPALAQTAGPATTQTAPAASAEAKTQLEEVVVSGVRASMQSSVAIKRNTQEIVDSVTAEDIGKLPDTNVAETLTRIPGIQGYRYGGEGASPIGAGSGLTIRGLSGQTASQVDGRSYATAGLREFNIEDAIPGMVAGIDVYKNPTAEHIEGGIGGLVNIRTRHPSDFTGATATVGVTGRYNEFDKHVKPELFGLVADKWDLSGGGRVGLVIGAVYQKSEGRSDNNPANGGATYRRSIRADDPEYAQRAAANSANNPNAPLAAYVGRSNVWALVDVPTLPCDNIATPCNVPDFAHGGFGGAALNASQVGNVMSATAQSQIPVGEEIIKRTRKGFQVAADWVVHDGLRLYAESNYTYYLYNQNYMFLNSVDGRNVQNLQTTPFALTEGLANRNLNGGSDNVLVGQRLAGATVLNSDLNVTGGDEHHPFWTAIGATGFEWNASPSLLLKGDVALTRSQVSDDNRSVNLSSAPGLWQPTGIGGWDVTRDLTGTPHTMTLAGPDLGSYSTWVGNFYNDGTNNVTRDKGLAVRLDAKYSFASGFFQDLKVGTRYAPTEDRFWSYAFTQNYNLTSNGGGLAGWPGAPGGVAYHANGTPVANFTDLLQSSVTNFMHGDAGYSGGYLVYSPAQLLGDTVLSRFPLANIPAGATRAEQLLSRRLEKEETTALYLMGDFAGFNDKIKGNVGVRVVRTHQYGQTYVNDLTQTPVAVVPISASKDYTNALPSLNVTYYMQPDLLVRLGYSKGITRPAFSDLNPTVGVNIATGIGTAGNPDLAPLKADSYDIALEKYFNATNYASLDFFDKELNGFAYGINHCETVPFTPPTSAPIAAGNSCQAGQYLITRTANAGNGYARGVEAAFQSFFDFLPPGIWQHFGTSGSFTYVDTSNPVNFGTPGNRRIVNVPQPFVSKYSYTLQAFYDDGKLSGRLVYSWRSDEILLGVSTNPIDGRYIGAYGILDASVNYNLKDALSITFNANNLTDKGLDRFVGEPAYATGIERQHYVNGRTYSLGVRYKIGG